MKILTIANEKGGVGKTLLSVQFAFYCRNKFGLRVAVLDLDQQGNISNCLKLSDNCSLSSIKTSDFLLEDNREEFKAKLGQSMTEQQGFCCFPADDRLSDVERQGSDYHQLFIVNFYENIQNLSDYFDLVIIDTNPNPDLRSNLGLMVATHLVSPLQLTKEPIDGISRLLGRLEVISSSINPEMTLDKGFMGMLPNMLESGAFQCANANSLFQQASGLMLQLTETQIQMTKDSSDKLSIDRDENGDAIIVTKNHYCAIKRHSIIAEAQAKGISIDAMPNSSKAWAEAKRTFFTMLLKINPERKDETTSEQYQVFNKALSIYGKTGREIIKNFWMTDSPASLPTLNLSEIQILRDMKKNAPLSVVL